MTQDILQYATRFKVGFAGHSVYIERYSNHGQELPADHWVVVRHLFPLGSDITNPLYLNSDGSWLYKHGNRWPSAQEAFDFLMRHASRPGERGWMQIRERPFDPYEPEVKAS